MKITNITYHWITPQTFCVALDLDNGHHITEVIARYGNSGEEYISILKSKFGDFIEVDLKNGTSTIWIRIAALLWLNQSNKF